MSKEQSSIGPFMATGVAEVDSILAAIARGAPTERIQDAADAAARAHRSQAAEENDCHFEVGDVVVMKGRMHNPLPDEIATVTEIRDGGFDYRFKMPQRAYGGLIPGGFANNPSEWTLLGERGDNGLIQLNLVDGSDAASVVDDDGIEASLETGRR